MLWAAIASSTLTSERSAGFSSAAPSYHQHRKKPAFKSRQKQHQQQIRQQEELAELQQEKLSLEQIARIGGQTKKHQKDVKKKNQRQVSNWRKKINLKSALKIFKAFTSCKCIQN